MSCLIEPILGIFVDCVSEPLKEQIGYVFCHKQKLQELETKLEEVKGAETRIKNVVEIAKNKGEHIHQDVQTWLLLDVVNCIKVTELLIKEVKEKQTTRCFFRYCLDITSRHKLGKDLVEQSKALADLYKKSTTFPTISYLPLPNEIWVPSTHHKDFVEFESRSQTLENIMVALGRSDINTVGVCGMGGVGKTTAVMEASVRSKQLNLFDKVLFATVSSKPDIEKIQGDLADMLGLEFHDQGERGRSNKLHDRLKQEKRLLVVLDDIWFSLDLEKVGIPHGDSHRGCKLLLTSRKKQVLENYMNSQMTLEVKFLETKEAWTLFKKVAGNRVEDPDLKDTADKISKKCAGLPISIVTVAKALKGKGVQGWKNALKELERPLIGNTTDIADDAYLSIKLSYDNLSGDDMKSVFLLCGYMGGYHIIDLVKYGVGLGFFQSFYSMEDSRTRVQSLVCSLEDCGLLLGRPKHDQFSIHDVVRDVAISIKTKDTEIFVMRENVGPEILPDVKTLKNCTAITLFDVYISELPDELNCPKLQFLHIFNKNSSLQIPENFFSLMVELRVVDLTNMIIESLPSSLLNVSNLRTLCLDHSILKDISGIGKLKSLEVLSFLWSKIQQLPEEIGELTNLKILDLDHCTELEVIPPGIISRLTRLEELYMNDSFKNWEYEGVPETKRRNANLAELKHLPNLTTFEAHIPDVLLIPKDLLTEKLVRFHIFVGKEWEWNEGYGYVKMLKLKHDRKDVLLDDGVLKLLKQAEELYLDEYKSMENVFCRLDLENFRHLKHLHVQNNSEMGYLVDSSAKIPDSGSDSLGVFPLMESFSLYNIINLNEIFKDKCRLLAFRILRTVKVEKCNLLKVLFPLYIAKKNLTLLEEISVIDCKNITNIFIEEYVGEIHEDIDDLKDLQIRRLTLKNLPELVSLCSEDSTESEPPLFSEKIQFPGLESLELESLCIKKIWTGASFSSQGLGKIIIDGCDLLEYVLSSSIVSRLVQLKQLEISNCKKIHQIVITEEETTTLLFPKLVILKMDNLQKLTSFFSGDHVEFPVLEHLQITKCPQMKELISVPSSNTSLVRTLKTDEVETDDGFYRVNASFNGKVEMMLSWIEIARLWPYQSLKTNLSVEWICSLILENCNNMVYLVPSYVTLTQLVRLEIRYCSNMVSILQPGYGNAVKFPKLKDLKLEDLASFSRIGDEEHDDFPVLEKIDIRNCPNMQCSVSNSAIALTSLEPNMWTRLTKI